MTLGSLLMRVWGGRLVFVTGIALLSFLKLVPLTFVPHIFLPPDLMFSLVLAFALRRPDFVPIWLVALVFLFTDLLLMRPPGLWSGIVVLSCEFLRAQEYRLRDLAFPFEWLFIGGTMLIAFLAAYGVRSLTLLPVPTLGAFLSLLAATWLSYPVVVFICHKFLRVRHITPQEAVRMGRRL